LAVCRAPRKVPPYLGKATPIPSIWGPRAGNPNPPLLPDEFAHVRAALRESFGS
jgi:hypothetical protein